MTRYSRCTLRRSLARTSLATALIFAAGANVPSADAQTFQYGYQTPYSGGSFGYDTNERFIRTPTPLPESNFQINVAPGSIQPYTPSYIPPSSNTYSSPRSYSAPSYYDYGTGYITPGRD